MFTLIKNLLVEDYLVALVVDGNENSPGFVRYHLEKKKKHTHSHSLVKGKKLTLDRKLGFLLNTPCLN